MVLLKHFFEHVIGFVDVLHDLFGCASLSAQVADDQQERRHSIQAANGFPTDRLIDAKQHPIPTIESRSLNDRVAQDTPCSLEIREDSFLVSRFFCCECHSRYRIQEINILTTILCNLPHCNGNIINR